LGGCGVYPATIQAVQKPPPTGRPITEEELLELEISEDRHLRRLGIDPGQDPFTIFIQLKKLRDALKDKS
jgi:hypothetical protein